MTVIVLLHFEGFDMIQILLLKLQGGDESSYDECSLLLTPPPKVETKNQEVRGVQSAMHAAKVSDAKMQSIRAKMGNTMSFNQCKMEEIKEKLSDPSGDNWDCCLESFTELKNLVCSLDVRDRSLFLSELLKMLPELEMQFDTQKSQISGGVSDFLKTVVHMYQLYIAEDSTSKLQQNLNLLVDRCFPSMLKLCQSSNSVMARQGIECIFVIFALNPGCPPSLVAKLCTEALSELNSTGRKLGAFMSITACLRQTLKPLGRNLVSELKKAIQKGIGYKDITVKQEAINALCAMYSRDETRRAVKNIDIEQRQKKKRADRQSEADADWAEGGAFHHLICTGNLDQKFIPLTSRVGRLSLSTQAKVCFAENVSLFAHLAISILNKNCIGFELQGTSRAKRTHKASETSATEAKRARC